MAFNMQCWGPSLTIQKFRTEEQKQHYIPKFVQRRIYRQLRHDGKPISAPMWPGMKCLAEDKGDHYLLNGNKMWITNGTVSNHGLLYVKTNKDAEPMESAALSWITASGHYP